MKKEEEVVKEEDKRPWEDLPGELLQGISNLSLSDRIRFRFTCKRWKTMNLAPSSIPLHIQCKFESSESPWFMFYHNKKDEWNYFHPMRNASYDTPISELAGAFVCHSKYGWLLMNRGMSFFFFHPIKKAIITLPDMPPAGDYCAISFSSPPTSPDCVVFVIELPGPTYSIVSFCAHGRDSWRRKWYNGYPPPISPSICNPVFYAGAFYCLCRDGGLVVFDVAKRSWNKIPGLRGPNMPISTSFIAECDGDLVSVFFGKVGSRVCVFKLDWNQKKWVNLQDLGNRMMFVSHATSLLLPSVTMGTENKIYLPRFREGGGNMFYCLCTGKYRCFEGEYSAGDWYDTFEQTNCTWIDLESNRIDSKIGPYSSEELDWLSNPPEDDLESDSEDD